MEVANEILKLLARDLDYDVSRLYCRTVYPADEGSVSSSSSDDIEVLERSEEEVLETSDKEYSPGVSGKQVVDVPTRVLRSDMYRDIPTAAPSSAPHPSSFPEVAAPSSPPSPSPAHPLFTMPLPSAPSTPIAVVSTQGNESMLSALANEFVPRSSLFALARGGLSFLFLFLIFVVVVLQISWRRWILVWEL